MITTKRRLKFVGMPDEFCDWILDSLGLDPTRVRAIRIDVGVDCAPTIIVEMYALSGEVESLPLGALESVEDAV